MGGWGGGNLYFSNAYRLTNVLQMSETSLKVPPRKYVDAGLYTNCLPLVMLLAGKAECHDHMHAQTTVCKVKTRFGKELCKKTCYYILPFQRRCGLEIRSKVHRLIAKRQSSTDVIYHHANCERSLLSGL